MCTLHIALPILCNTHSGDVLLYSCPHYSIYLSNNSWAVLYSYVTAWMGLLPDTQNCGLLMRRECRHRLQRKPLISDPSMHHGTCVTHVSWCMLGSLTRSGRENVPGIPGACATPNVAYLVRGPCHRVIIYLCNNSHTSTSHTHTNITTFQVNSSKRHILEILFAWSGTWIQQGHDEFLSKIISEANLWYSVYIILNNIWNKHFSGHWIAAHRRTTFCRIKVQCIKMKFIHSAIYCVHAQTLQRTKQTDKGRQKLCGTDKWQR